MATLLLGLMLMLLLANSLSLCVRCCSLLRVSLSYFCRLLLLTPFLALALLRRLGLGTLQLLYLLLLLLLLRWELCQTLKRAELLLLLLQLLLLLSCGRIQRST